MSETREMVFLNGRIIPAADARVSAFDAGFTHAAGLFETMRAYNGKVLHAEAHLDRLTTSATALDMLVQTDGQALRQGIQDVLAANDLADARLRLTVTPGQVPRPGEPIEAAAEPTILITAGRVVHHPPDLYTHGMRVCICPYKQSRWNPLAGHKTLAYLPRLLAMKDAAERKCNEALWFTTENHLAEASVSNVFAVRKGVIVTPPVETPVLPGIVRHALIELAKANDMPIEQRPIDIDELLASTEVFLTGSVMEIMPVTAIEKHQVGEGSPGEVTRRLTALYRELVQKECGIK